MTGQYEASGPVASGRSYQAPSSENRSESTALRWMLAVGHRTAVRWVVRGLIRGSTPARNSPTSTQMLARRPVRVLGALPSHEP